MFQTYSFSLLSGSSRLTALLQRSHFNYSLLAGKSAEWPEIQSANLDANSEAAVFHWWDTGYCNWLGDLETSVIKVISTSHSFLFSSKHQESILHKQSCTFNSQPSVRAGGSGPPSEAIYIRLTSQKLGPTVQPDTKWDIDIKDFTLRIGHTGDIQLRLHSMLRKTSDFFC